jgi:hypothetical protein
MNKFIEIFNNLVVASFKQIIELLTQFGPKILFAFVVVILGWVFAVIVKKIISKLLKALGFDVLSDKLGLMKFLQRGDISRNPSSIIGLVFFWLIILNSFIMASDIISIGVATQLVQQVIIYLPKIAVVIIIISLGIIIGKFVGTLAYKATLLAKIPFSILVGKLSCYIIIGLAFLLALDYLEVSSMISLQFSIIIISIIPLFIYLTLLIGGKDVVSNIVASRFIKKEYNLGDTIKSGDISGEIVDMDIFAVKIKINNEEVVIPNSKLINLIVTRKTRQYL